jgi:hypothetical protein
LKAIEPDAHERQLIEAAQRDPSRFGELYETNFAPAMKDGQPVVVQVNIEVSFRLY